VLVENQRPLSLAFVAAALAWAWLVTAVVLLAAAAGRSEGAWGDLLLAVTSLGPLGWIAWSERRVLLEGLLIGALSFAPLVVAAAYANDAARGAGLVYAAGAGLLLTWGAAGAPRRVRVALAGGIGLALPLGLWTWADLGQSETAALAPFAPGLSLREVLAGGGVGRAGLVLVVTAALAVLTNVLVRRFGRAERAPGAGPASAPLSAPVLGAAALGLAALLSLSNTQGQDRPLLGANLRPDEPAPRDLRPAPERPAAARSFGHRYLAAQGSGGVRLVPLPLAGHLEVEVLQDEAWVRRPGASERFHVLRGRELLVGCVGESAWRASASFLPDARRVRLTPDQAPALAEAGSAFDLVLVSPGQAPRLAGALRAWTAAGGLLALSDSTDLERLGVPLPEQGLQRVRLGSGSAVSPLTSQGWGPLAAAMEGRWDERHPRRGRRQALNEVLLLDPDPRPGGLGSLAAALLALALIWSALAALSLRLRATTTVAGAWVVALVAGALLRALLPSGPVWTASRQVLEAPSGSLAAARSEFVTTLQLRPEAARLELNDFAPPFPAFLSEGEAIQASAELRPADSTQRASVTLPSKRGVRAFRRLDACELPGQVTLEVAGDRVRVENRLGAPLRDCVLLGPSGVVPLGRVEVGAQAETRWSAEPESLASWRSNAAAPADARWRRLVGAALRGRGGRWVLAARVPGRSAVASGAAGEEVRSALLIVTGPRRP